LKSGEPVVVKIQYPGIADAVRSDLQNVDALVGTMSRAIPTVDIEQSLKDFASRLEEECDYRLEAGHQAEFARLWDLYPLLPLTYSFEIPLLRHVLLSGHMPSLKNPATEKKCMLSLSYR